MMEKGKRYEKPSIEYIEMQSNHALADKCWGNHGTGVRYEYTCQHGSTIVFHINGGSCDITYGEVDWDESMLDYEKGDDVWAELILTANSEQPVKEGKFHAIGGGSN